MTKEQEEAIEMLEDIKNNSWTTKYIMSSDSKKADTVLSLIKEQQEKIENTTTNYKNLIADVSRIAKELGLEEYATIDEIYTAIRILKSKRINVIEQLDCIEVKNKEIDKLKAENKDLFSRLNKQLKQKDKQIDLMAISILVKKIGDYPCGYKQDCIKSDKEYRDIHCKDCIKQYYERKVEDVKD